jgi:hypothetical protein
MRTLIATVGAMLLASSAFAAPGRCLLRVEGTTYLNGQCNVLSEPDGSFSIGVVDDESEKLAPYFAIVTHEQDGAMRGTWNAQAGATHAQTPLGKLRRNGGCWENASASVCAWR